MFRRTVKRAFRLIGLDIRPHDTSPAAVLERMLRIYAVDTILDIGANTGQSGESFRSMGFSKKIVSFEPVSHLYEQLRIKAASDPLWQAEKLALGRSEGRAQINVSGGHAGASSLLEMTDNVRHNAPNQRVVGEEQVEVTTLAAMLDKHYPQGNRCFLKMDVQGAEKSGLDGGLNVLDRVVGMKIEMSLIKNYEGEVLMCDMLPFVDDLGFRPVCFENGWGNSGTGELYQVDCIFFRTRAAVDSSLP